MALALTLTNWFINSGAIVQHQRMRQRENLTGKQDESSRSRQSTEMSGSCRKMGSRDKHEAGDSADIMVCP